jgi:hypothetical protein
VNPSTPRNFFQIFFVNLAKAVVAVSLVMAIEVEWSRQTCNPPKSRVLDTRQRHPASLRAAIATWASPARVGLGQTNLVEDLHLAGSPV